MSVPGNSARNHHGSGPGAALTGASLAFNRHKSRIDQLPESEASGAAASRGPEQARTISPARTGRSSSSRLSRHATGESASGSPVRHLHPGAVTQRLLSASAMPPADPRATSFIAATLAASRSASPSPSPQHTGRRTNRAQVPTPAEDAARWAVDAKATPPPTVLPISAFEGRTDTEPVKKTPAGSVAPDDAAARRAAVVREFRPRAASPHRAVPASATRMVGNEDAPTLGKLPTAPPAMSWGTAGVALSPVAPKQGSREPSPRDDGRPSQPVPPRSRSRQAGASSQSRTDWSLAPHRMGTLSNLPLDSLASAIVAGSLASGKHPPSSPSSQEAPRRSSPKRAAMPQTLRPTQSKSDDEDARRHRSLVSGKHKHHEGSRRRWKEEMTARERKRYEAVWASNRGLFLPVGDDCVVNLVVRDIWGRSRLPFEELAEVWDLVDNQGLGRLAKDEFVVGMWLIDQRLRGRKIPTRVGDSVWRSAKGISAPG